MKKRKTRGIIKLHKPTVSHLILYVFLSLYVFVAIFTIIEVTNLYNIGHINNANYLLMGLFSFIGVSASIAIPFYFNKSKAENTIRENNIKYKMRFEMAKDVTKAYTKGEINDVGLKAMLSMISDKDTSINIGGWGENSTIEEIKYNAPNFIPPIQEGLSNTINPLESEDGIYG